MQKSLPLPHSRWRHYKSSPWDDRTYEVIDIAYHSETDEALVLYKPLYTVKETSCIFWKDIIARPISSWYDVVEKDGQKMQRFTQI